MKPLLAASEIRSWDQFTIKEQRITSYQLMENAAKAFCTLYVKMFSQRKQKICVLCGPGNNGGDGFAIARLLFLAGFQNICVFEISGSKDGLLNSDRNRNRNLLQNFAGITWFQNSDELQLAYKTKTFNTIDALFGTGLNRPVSNEYRSIFDLINKWSQSTVSVDIPSGLQSDQETLTSEVNNIISAHHTFTFQTYKRAMTFPETGSFCGKIHLVDIGLSMNFVSHSSNNIYLLDKSIWNKLENSKTFDHKGSNGKALQFCGSIKMPGAGILCSRAAHRSGAGYVMAIIPKENVTTLICQHPEVLPIAYNEAEGISFDKLIGDVKGISSILAGPGLGNTDFVQKSIHQLLDQSLDIPLILDADALNVLNGETKLLSKWQGHVVITPHAKEFDRLFGEAINWYEREQTMRRMAESLNICIVLKGAFTRVAFGDGSLYINTSGNPGLSKAGSGDVLSGILSALLARYKNFKNAVLSAVYIHGKAADDLAEKISEKSILATDLIDQLGESIKMLESNG